MKSGDWLFGPGLNFFFLYACLCFTGSLAFVVGGDTVISSCTWKKDRGRILFQSMQDFYRKDLFFLGTKQGFFSSAFFPHLSEKPAQLMSDAFSFCNFVYWFSIHINIPVYNSVFLTKQMAWAILYLKLEATFLIGICSVGFASLVFIHWYTLRVRDGAMCSQHYLAVKCINLALGWLKTLTFIYFDPFAYSHVASTVL